MDFQFKKFSVKQDKCAMKVGTDGVLLGAWTPLTNNPYNILDIGSGTGLISLMLAQRCFSEQIDAIEIDDEAYEQCVENFENSNWGDRLFCYHASFQEFVQEMYEEEAYDLIVSNPPFYTSQYKSDNEQRDLARFEDALPFDHLLHGSSLLLSENGIFSTIIPFQEEENFVQKAAHFNLFPFKLTRVKGTPASEIKRSLIAFSKNKNTCEITELIIENSRHNYTEAYIELTQEFYLKM